MKSQSFQVRLISEVSVGSPGSVQGGRDTMDYLQGGLFMGAAAARLYTALGDDAWTVFHTGKVRFGDALPASSSGLTAFPTPQSLAQKKHEETAEKSAYQADELINLAFEPRSAKLDKVATPYLSSAGEKVRPQTQYRLKTAIDPRSGGSMDRRLYGYHSLLPDQVYHFRLDADDDVPDALFEKLKAVFAKPTRLGRSKSAEYGRVEITPMEHDFPTPVPCEEGLLTLLLCSHLAVEGAGGATPALPTSRELGLPDGALVTENCFVRHSWHSIYNAAYRAFERDVPIITRGSVLCYRMAPEDLAKVTRSPLHYAGLLQQRGFGCMLVNPPFLAKGGAKLAPAPQKKGDSNGTATANGTEIKHDLAEWLLKRVEDRNAETAVRIEAEKWFKELKDLYESARVRGGFTPDMIVGPTPSQWGRVSEVTFRALAKEKIDLEALKKDLFGSKVGDQSAPICNDNDPDWSKVIVDPKLEEANGKPPNFADWLKHKLEAESSKSAEFGMKVLAHFARFAADRAKQQRNPKEGIHA